MLNGIRHTLAVLTGSNGYSESQPLVGQNLKEIAECIKNVRRKEQKPAEANN